jgi:trk system potassium uptake protein TrkA
MKIVIIGCGRMGSGLAQMLSLRGHNVTVVDRDAAAFENLGPTFTGQTVVGIGFDRDVLEAADIRRADGLASVTNSDEANIVAARLAREHFHVPRVVARVVEPHKAEIYRRLGLQTIATTTWGIHRMANVLSYAEFEVTLDLGNEVEMIEAEIPPLLAGRTVNSLAIPGELQVVAITRAGKTFLPSGNTLFQSGDSVHLALLAASADRVAALLRVR